MFSQLTFHRMPGDAAYMGLLPWLVDSYAAAIRHLPPAPSGSADRGVRLVGSLLASLRCCMEAASSGGDAASWSTAVTASATVLRAAHRCELLGAGAGVQEALSSHLALVMGQFEQLNAPEAGGACCHLFSSLSDVDVRVCRRPMCRMCGMPCGWATVTTQRGAESAARDAVCLQHTATLPGSCIEHGTASPWCSSLHALGIHEKASTCATPVTGNQAVMYM